MTKRENKTFWATIYPYQVHLYELDNRGVSLGNSHSIIDQPLHNCFSDDSSQGIVVARGCVPSHHVNNACPNNKNIDVTTKPFSSLGLTKISRSDIVCNEPCDTDFCNNTPIR